MEPPATCRDTGGFAPPVACGAITLGAESVGLQDGGFGPGRLGRGSAGIVRAIYCRLLSSGVRVAACNVKGNSLEADRSYGCPVRSRSPRARSFRLGTNQDRPHLLRLARVRHRQQLKPERRVDSAQEPGQQGPLDHWLAHPRQRRSCLPLRAVHASRRLDGTVHTGSGSNTARHRYWRSDAYIWNNDGDRATLRNRAGRRVDRRLYRGTGSAVNC